jgi:MFS family permease
VTTFDPARADRDQVRAATQRRAVPVLAAAQVLGGVGVASGVAVGALLAERISGSTAWAGLATTMSVLGGAVLALPMARLADRDGRRIALTAGYACGAVGAVVTVLAGRSGPFWLLLLGMGLFGGGTASGLQARYAATDAAAPGRLGRDLGTVVWATTVGAVAGPNLSQVGDDLGRRLGLPALTGPFLFSLAGFLASAALVQLALRPDPLLLTRRLREEAEALGPDTPRPARLGVLAALRTAASRPPALLGLITIGCAHAVMVGVMVMTPLHLAHGGATLTVVGVVISLHIAGMYAASPIMGLISDRAGRHAGIAVGVGLFTGALLLAGTSAPESHARLAVGLTLLGLGWSACLISGSALLTESVPAQARTSVQGLSDLVMGAAGASAGALSGPLMAASGYPALSVVSGVLLVPVLVLATAAVLRRPPSPAPG